MWHVAIYHRRQHQQFVVSRSRFTLIYSVAEDRWTLAEGHARPLSGPAIRLRATTGALVVDCRGIQGAIDVESVGLFNASIPAELTLPALFQLDETWIEVRATRAEENTPLGLEPLHLDRRDASVSLQLAAESARGPDSQTVARWLAAAGQLHRTAASSPEFFAAAARLALDSTGLDAAMVITYDGGRWQIAGSAVPRPHHGISFEPAALAAVLREPCVLRRPPPTRVIGGPATVAESIVVAPVRDDAGHVVAAVYGVRHGRGDNRRQGIRTLEARVIELMADAVAVGMARREQEIESARQQVLLEQAFSPTVATHLLLYPQALAGKARDVTLLFADLRSFTSLAEGLSPADAYELLGAVMESLTQAIMEHDGVVIDYFGDGVSALWNAPIDVPEHADQACAAALEMLQTMPKLSRQWQQLLGVPLELGVGLHSAKVQVGNAGTRRRLKYGPRGSGVNIASRVQAAAKRLEVPLLVTDAVRRQLSARFVTLKVCTARLPGLEQPLELFTALPAGDATAVQQDLERYAAALTSFERGDLDAAERELEQLLERGPATPAAFLAQQTAALRQGARGRRATDEFGYTSDAVIEILAK